MKRNENITGFRKFLFYVRMSLACAWRYWRHSAALMKASQLTRIFYKHKLKRLASGEYKLDFYLPRYPSQAFFTALEDKVICRPGVGQFDGTRRDAGEDPPPRGIEGDGRHVVHSLCR